ncbi:DNA helicase [Marisediminicola sp. LYQ134]|uniref:DNA helicase n=1 Tax=unclassified Marisediminicola TaxID=2618316 RepID=UPI003983CB06
MGLSRKRAKELKRLRKTSSELWEEQRDVLDHASNVVREAGRQLGNVSREEVVPRARGAYDDYVVPAVSTARGAVGDARHKIVHDVLPGVSGALASALATLEVSKDPRVREAVKQVHKTSDRVSKNANKAFSAASKKASKAYTTVGTKAGFVKPKPSLGFGGWVLISLGVVAVAGIAYAAYQTLRADDELWVLDEGDDIEAPKE